MKRNRLTLPLTLAAIMMVTMLFSTNAMADDGTKSLDWIPADTMMVLSVDVEQLRGTDVYKEVMGALEKEADFKKAMKEMKDKAGFDPEKDLTSFLIAVPPDVEKSENFLFIANGKFDSAKIVDAIKAEGDATMKDMKHNGTSYYDIDGEGGLLFDGNSAIIGTTAAIKASIDAKKDKKGVSTNKKVSALIKDVDTSADVWMAVNLPKSIQDQMKKENPMAGDVETAHASIDLGKGLKLRLSVGTKSADTAKSLVEMANAGLQGAAGDPSVAAMGLDAALKNLAITASGQDIDIKLDLTKDEFNKIKQTIQALAGM